MPEDLPEKPNEEIDEEIKNDRKRSLQMISERLLKNAEVFERHHRLGHFKKLNGKDIASELRIRAREILEKYD